MDFWSRLVGGTSRLAKQTSPKKATPQQRLDRFKRTYNSVLQICSQPQRLGQPGPLLDQLLAGLRQLSGLLREELRSPTPYPCLTFANASQIYGVIGRAASACKDERIIQEAVGIFSILIDSEMEGFVSSRTFARALMRFSMRMLDAYYVYVSHETESQLVEVLFNIAAKIRLEPDILAIWFAPSGRAEDEEAFLREKQSFVGITQKDDFPLCYLFIDRVHSEGRIGDFARTGLLYIFEAAPRAPALESWIVASDLPTLMASALGALYSQLSRELSLLQDQNDLPMLLAMSDYLEHNKDAGVESISSESHKLHMSTFLSDLTFWQDILDHCRSIDVRQTLLDHFQVLFLQQLLYPSLLQSSDTDGGSSVAVMTYLNSVLQTLTDEGLSNMILSYLVGTQALDKPLPPRPPSPRVTRRRSSLMQLATLKSGEDALEPSLFNLVDLIHNGMQSHNAQTTFAALKLFTTILTLQPKHALGNLLKLSPEAKALPERTIGALSSETSALLGIASAIGGPDGLEEAFAGASYDFKKAIELVVLRRVQANHNADSRNNSVIFAELLTRVPTAMLDLNDTGLKSLLNLVRSFLVNGVETNLALSEAVAAICISMDVDLSELLAVRPDKYHLVEESARFARLDETWLDNEESVALKASLGVCREPVLRDSNMPALHASLLSVQKQVSFLRQSLSRFDALLSKRKAILQAPEQADKLFATPAKSVKTQKPAALSLSRHVSPSPVPRPGSKGHARNLSVTSMSSRNESPARQSSIPPRGRRLSGMAPAPTSPIRSSPAPIPKTSPSKHSRQGSIVVSPVRSLNASVFRPPPPEPSSNLSPPRMAALARGNISPPKATLRNVSASGQEVDTLDPTSIAFPFDQNPFLSPGRAGRAPDSVAPENDAELLNLRIRFDKAGNVAGIGAPSVHSNIASGTQSPNPAGLASRLRGEAVPPSSRGSSVPGDETPDRRASADLVRPGRESEGSALKDEVRGDVEDDDSSESGGMISPRAGEDDDDDAKDAEEVRDVSLSHVLTNIVVLQNFILELVAIMQHRARIYEGEVRFH